MRHSNYAKRFTCHILLTSCIENEIKYVKVTGGHTKVREPPLPICFHFSKKKKKRSNLTVAEKLKTGMVGTKFSVAK